MRRPKTRRQAVAYLTVHVARAWVSLARQVVTPVAQLARGTRSAYRQTWVEWEGRS